MTPTRPNRKLLAPRITLALALCASTFALFPARANAEEGAQTQSSAGAEGEPKETKDANVVETIASQIPDASDETASVEEVSRDELREQGAPSVLDALARRAPWLYFQTNGSGNFGIGRGSLGDQSVRGAGGPPGSARMLTVWDGVPDLNGAVGRPLPDFYVDALLESTQLVSGGDSVRWGTNAMTGVLALESRWRENPGWEAEVEGGAGHFGQLQAQAAALGNVNGWSIATALTRRSSQGPLDYSENAVSTAQAAVRKRGSWGQFTGRLRYGLLDGKNAGSFAELSPNNWYISERGTGSLEYVGKINILTARVSLFGSLGKDRLYTGTALDDRQIGARSEITIAPSKKLRVLAGLAIDHVSAELTERPEGTTPELDPISTSAPWAEVRYVPIERLTLIAGGRYVVGLLDRGAPFYKVGAVLDTWKGGKLRGRVSRNFRQPTIADKHLLPPANPDLEPEISRTSEVGLSQFVGDKLELRSTLYHMDATNYIQPTGVPPNVSFENIGESTQWGVEWNTIITPVSWFEFGTGGAWADVGDVTAQNPNVRLGGWTTLRHSGWRGTINFSHTRGRFERNEEVSPLDPITNLGANVSWAPDPRFEVYGQANNLLDLDNAPLSGYSSVGRSVFVGFRATLKSVTSD